VREVPAPLRIVLWPFSLIYRGAVLLRAWLYRKGWLKQRRLNGMVISVGNITVGGTGKTPMVIWLAEKFLAEGKRVAILSRGYRGSEGSSDEVELMKERLQGRALFGVGKDRYEAGRRLESQGVDVFLLDDGFQHLQLARDVDIVLIDATRRFGRQSLLPVGSLREPVSAVNRADLVLFTRTNHAPGTVWAIEQVPQFPVFLAKTKLTGFRSFGTEGTESRSLPDAAGPFFAFCGIGNPDAFFRDLREWKIEIVGRSKFRDHHRYTGADVSKLEQAAQKAGAKAFVTTEKDAQNFGKARFTLPVYIAVMAMEVPDEEEVLRLIKEKLCSERVAAA
jgi:tetraacyldisaccharide 4'-kinase